MPSHPFVHLHNHTQYSLLDGAQKIEEMIQRAAGFGMSAVAITDHGNIFGAIKFLHKAQAGGVRPILGVEAYVSPGDRREKAPVGGVKKPYYHLVILAKNYSGYRNLLQLVSKGYLEGFYYRPRIDKALLAAHAEGLIVLSGCLGGEIATLLRTGRDVEAEAVAREYAGFMGEGNYYLEIQDQGLPEELALNPKLVDLSHRTGIPLVATNDCHFLDRADHAAHDVLLCIQTGRTVNDADRMRYTQEHYFKSGPEMEAVFPDLPEAIENSGKIAAQCEFLIETGRNHLPDFAVPGGGTLDAHFEEVARAGFAERLPVWQKLAHEGRLAHTLEDYRARLDAEIRMIQQMGFPGYFLVVWDLIREARSRGIPVGPGRGSAAGSLVAFCLRITDVDPIAYDLIFERFLNPERISMPDIDIDFCFRRRDEVIHYVTEKYGRANVAQIITFGTMAAKAVLRDVGRALGLPYADVDRIAKMIPVALDATIDKALLEVPALKELYEKEEPIQRLVDLSRRLEGLSRHASTHAAGVVISPRPIVEFAPLYKGPGEADEVTTGYAKDEIEEIGLLKMDFLGLKTLTYLEDAARFIRETEGIAVDLDSLPLDDPKTYELFCKANTSGVFQFESGGMRDILRRLKPDRFEDLIALNALYRPGPIKSGMIDDFIRRRHGEVAVEYPHPLTEPILGPTWGVIVYQEQVMQVASALAGYSLGQADLLRKAMGKKKIEVMQANREKFIAGCRATARLSEKEAGKIFDLMEHFAGYGFNRSHSAAYALVAYRTAWVKAHWPVHFMAALLTSEKGSTEKMVQYLQEAQREMGIPVLPPDVNVSGMDFTVEGRSIRFGLSAVRNVGEGAVASILEARERLGGRFASLWEFCREVDRRALNKRVVESLIKAGCLDSFGATRPRLVAALDLAFADAARRQETVASGQGDLFGGAADEADSADVSAAKRAGPPLPEAPPWTDRELLAGEKETLGFYLTGHPLAAHAPLLQALATHSTGTLETLSGETGIVLGGLITAPRKRKSKNGEWWATFHLEDLDGAVEVLMFPRAFAPCADLVQADRTVIVRGRAEVDEDRIRVIAEEILPLDGAREAQTESIQIALGGIGEDRLRDLAGLLRRHPGRVPVTLVMDHPADWRLSLSPDCSVAPSPWLTEALHAMLGEEAVRFRLRRLSPPQAGRPFHREKRREAPPAGRPGAPVQVH